MSQKYRIINDVYLLDINLFTGGFMDRLVAEAGDIVYGYTGPTYGVISPRGMAVSHDGEIPFFEVAWNNVERVEEV